MGILSGKRGLVIGVSNKWSIGSQIAKECVRQGADTFITWHSDRSRDYVEWLKEDLDHMDPMIDSGCFQLDITNPDISETIRDNIRYDQMGGLDFIVHSVARAPKECFQQPFSHTTLEQWNETMKVSVWSFINLINNVKPFLNSGCSLITLSYLAAKRVTPGYKLMSIAKSALESSVRELAYELGDNNIRVNALSLSPVKTTSTYKIGVEKGMKTVKDVSPLKRNINESDITGAAIFMLSNMSSGITGSILDVDSGFSIMSPYQYIKE